jgi:hypothetical protein
LGSKTKQKRFFSPGPKKSPVDEARDLLATVVLAHVPVSYYAFYCLEGRNKFVVLKDIHFIHFETHFFGKFHNMFRILILNSWFCNVTVILFNAVIYKNYLLFMYF